MTSEPESGGRRAAAFKLRFPAAPLRGRSRISPLRPPALPAVLADKWWAEARGEWQPAEEAALRRVQAAFARGPRLLYPRPVLSSHEYGWWDSEWRSRMRAVWAGAPAGVVRGAACSAWLRHRLRELAERHLAR